jgi:uncharacterized tellurite resistance protein B-like protein
MAILVPAALKDATEEQLCAVLEVMYYVAHSDGVFSEEEITHFLRVANAISGGKITAAKLGVVVGGWSQREEIKLEDRVTELAKILQTPTQREIACNLAAQLAEADDAVLVPEQDALQLIGRTFFPS